mgnify:CR=1 FL=1
MGSLENLPLVGLLKKEMVELSRLCASPPQSGIRLRAAGRNLTAAEAESSTLA